LGLTCGALDTYDWEGWALMTDNGITVSGFWDKSKGSHPRGIAFAPEK